MPIVESGRLDWAKESEEKEPELENGFKKVVEYRNEDGKTIKVTNIFKVDRIKLPRSIAERKNWSKFGEAKSDPTGVISSTTVVGDEVFMQFLSNKEEPAKDIDPNTAALSKITCRYCKGDHWTTKCPHKSLYEEIERRKDEADSLKKPEVSSSSGGGADGAYKPPSMRSGAASQAGASGKKFEPRLGQKEEFTIRVTNLPEEATEPDLKELFKPFGSVSRVFLAKDKNTQQSRGFAFVTFTFKEDAQRAIIGVDNFGYHHLILKVEWAKPSNN